MGWSKKLKKWALPGIGGKIIGNKLFADKKKKGPLGPTEETPEQLQARLDQELLDYGDIDKNAYEGAEKRSQEGGTYAPTTAFKESLEAESGAAARQLKGAAQDRVNALRRRLKQPESPFGTI